MSGKPLALSEQVRSNIAKMREDAEWSQGELSRRLIGLGWTVFHQTTIARIEGGTRPVKLDELPAFAEVFGVDLEDFLGDKVTVRREAEYRRMQGLIHDQKSAIREAAIRMLIAQERLRELAPAVGLRIPDNYEQVRALDDDDAAKSLYFRLSYDPVEDAEQARKMVASYKAGKPQFLVEYIYEQVGGEVRHGEHKETR